MMNSITRSTWGRWPLAALLLGLLALTALLSASPAAAESQTESSPPGRVDSVSVTRANGSLTASWDAPAGATRYHITYSSDSAASWSLGAYDHTTTSLTISADNAKTYIVGVRAGNDAGWSAWRNSQSSGPYTPPAPPATPTSVSVTRSDETLHVSWPAVDGATGYHITYAIASAGDRSWVAAASNHPTNSIDIKHVLNATSYIVGVRALNDGGGSGWRNSAPTGGFLSPKPLPSPPTSVTVTRGDGTLTVSWPAATNATSYSVFLKDNSDNTWKEAALFIEQTSLSVDASNYLDYTASVRSHNGTGDSHSVDSAVSAATATLLPPASITVTRGDGTLSASWPAADGATAYHVGWSDNNGASWHRERTSYAGTSINFTVPTIDNAKSYAVNVMSVIGDVQSVWRYSDFAPPYIVATPARPASVTIVRTDGALTASWDAVQNAATYHVTYSSDGKASWSLAVYDHTRTSIEISADNAKTYFVAVRGLNSQGTGGAWRDSAPAGPYTPTPPAAPANLAVAPGNGFLGITWDAVADATGYDVRVKPQGASDWTTVATNHANTTYNYATTTTIDHVGVRARNADGVSDWVNVSRLPSSELLSTVSGEVSGMGGIAMAESNIASGQSEVSGQSNQVSGQSQLSAPVWGTINRTVNRQKVEIDLNWTHTGWATGFNLVCSDTDGWSWNVCGWDDDGTVSYTSVPTAESRPVKITHYRRGSDSPHTPGDYDFSKSRHYTVAIRAVNANPSQASDWVSTQIIRPIFPALRNFTWTRTDNQITMSWTPNPWTTGYKVYCDNYTSGGTYNPSYDALRDADEPEPRRRDAQRHHHEVGRDAQLVLARRHEHPRHRHRQHERDRLGPLARAADRAAAHADRLERRRDDGDADHRQPHRAMVVQGQHGAGQHVQGPGRIRHEHEEPHRPDDGYDDLHLQGVQRERLRERERAGDGGAVHDRRLDLQPEREHQRHAVFLGERPVRTAVHDGQRQQRLQAAERNAGLHCGDQRLQHRGFAPRAGERQPRNDGSRHAYRDSGGRPSEVHLLGLGLRPVREHVLLRRGQANVRLHQRRSPEDHHERQRDAATFGQRLEYRQLGRLSAGELDRRTRQPCHEVEAGGGVSPVADRFERVEHGGDAGDLTAHGRLALQGERKPAHDLPGPGVDVERDALQPVDGHVVHVHGVQRQRVRDSARLGVVHDAARQSDQHNRGQLRDRWDEQELPGELGEAGRRPGKRRVRLPGAMHQPEQQEHHHLELLRHP